MDRLKLAIDMNCDMGEAYGIYQMGLDHELVKYVTSANIACGFHAGDPATMRKTVRLCLDHGVSVGAHPGLDDVMGFGRRAVPITPEEGYDLMVYQLGAICAFVKAEGSQLHHVKPHGALYHMASTDMRLARSIVEAIRRVDERLILYGLPGSCLLQAGEEAGLTCAKEAFADRTYQADGSLTSRALKNAVISDINEAVNQVLQIIKDRTVRTVQGTNLPLYADTICIHGDGAHALQLAEAMDQALQREGIHKRAVMSQGG